MIENPKVLDIEFSAAQLVAASLKFWEGATPCGGNSPALALNYVHDHSISLQSAFKFPKNFPNNFPDPKILPELEKNQQYKLKSPSITYALGKDALIAAIRIQPVIVYLAVYA